LGTLSSTARTVRALRLGLALPQYDCSLPGVSPLPFDAIVDWAVRAEALGFDSLWLSDHLTWDLAKYGGDDTRYGVYDPLVVLGALARATTRARLGTLVLCEALRPPAVLAKALAAIDRLSDGRLDVGLGAGWYEPDYAAIGTAMPPPAVRIDRLAETVQVVRPMLHAGRVDFEGRFHHVHASNDPRPRQAEVPVFVGGKGNRLLRLAARHADGWNTCWTWTTAAYRERAVALDAACEQAGRDPATVSRSLGLYALCGEDERDLERRFERLCALAPAGTMTGMTLERWRESRLVGTVEQVREQADGWAALGVETLILGVGAVPFHLVSADDVELLAAALGERVDVGGGEPR
jgi:probable F420-dependent oxidoreductase